MQFLSDHIVAAGNLHELRELALQRSVLLAQHFDLPLDERDRGAAPDVWETQARQQRLMALEKLRIALQVGRDRFLFGFSGRQATGFSCCHMLQTST